MKARYKDSSIVVLEMTRDEANKLMEMLAPSSPSTFRELGVSKEAAGYGYILFEALIRCGKDL